MKRVDLLRRLQSYGCTLKREHDDHSIWQNQRTAQIQSLPRHTIFGSGLARKVCVGLSVPPL